MNRDEVFVFPRGLHHLTTSSTASTLRPPWRPPRSTANNQMPGTQAATAAPPVPIGVLARAF
jgi:hypothetical protein